MLSGETRFPPILRYVHTWYRIRNQRLAFFLSPMFPSLLACSHKKPTRESLAPLLCCHRSLTSYRCCHPIGSHRKGGIDRIADHFEDEAAMGANDLAQDGIVASQGCTHRLGMMFPAGGAAFNIGEEKGDSASGSLGHEC